MSRRRKIPLTPVEEAYLQKRRTLEKLLKNYQLWKSTAETEGVFTVVVDGDEYHLFDILYGIDQLPRRQRQALVLICLEDLREVDAARQMGFTKWSTPAQQYKNAALDRLMQLRAEVDGETIDPSIRKGL